MDAVRFSDDPVIYFYIDTLVVVNRMNMRNPITAKAYPFFDS